MKYLSLLLALAACGSGPSEREKAQVNLTVQDANLCEIIKTTAQKDHDIRVTTKNPDEFIFFPYDSAPTSFLDNKFKTYENDGITLRDCTVFTQNGLIRQVLSNH